MGHDAASKNYYEMNARSLITIWGDSYHLTDYANRSWAGLTNQYYSVRWDRFINEVIKAVEKRMLLMRKPSLMNHGCMKTNG